MKEIRKPVLDYEERYLVSNQRRVAMCFLENPDNYPEVNHINENKLDNRVENLEWCIRQYNVNYGSRVERHKLAVSKPVMQCDLSGNAITHFHLTVHVGRVLALNHSSISACCKGKRKTCGGYRWKYE